MVADLYIVKKAGLRYPDFYQTNCQRPRLNRPFPASAQGRGSEKI